MWTNRILKAKQKINTLSTQLFTEKELRGLSKAEKEFIRENDMKVQIVLNQGLVYNSAATYYMFVAKNRTGKKQLYAISKKQSISPNGNDVSKSAFNYECWLTLDPKTGFNKFNYERRFCKTPSIGMIFA